MATDFARITRERSSDLYDLLMASANCDLWFDGYDPLEHSRRNHVHLDQLEVLAERHAWIDLEYRTKFIKYIFAQWRIRLKGMKPYTQDGYRLYLYGDIAPTLTVVAETDTGFPFSHIPHIFVNEIRDIMSLYIDTKWSDRWQLSDWPVSAKQIEKAVVRYKGSIGKPVADTLGIRIGELRNLIINMGLDYEINRIRKRFRRSPADFSNELGSHGDIPIFERRLAAFYD
ncbi:MAG: hypothetical protein ABW117_17720 [Candidatus Sedimenticola sp. 1PA]